LDIYCQVDTYIIFVTFDVWNARILPTEAQRKLERIDHLEGEVNSYPVTSNYTFLNHSYTTPTPLLLPCLGRHSHDGFEALLGILKLFLFFRNKTSKCQKSNEQQQQQQKQQQQQTYCD